ncbi:MAG: hypothetical protein BGO21_04690 [Dyadobacter sp. 50-39]|uniref:hypothetical protein n=1 Tax=Dyadobacter sp. 50-39 TaxID=1895756 RepID=UPI00096247DE|nr:hypothetical protein [Dyadobacter sp. 50-39]OJV13031.1 MAG: hypothetical protein BGO21_04690 [Dyadobacter sp. 50-39]
MKYIALLSTVIAVLLLACNATAPQENTPVDENAKMSEGMKRQPFIDTRYDFQRIRVPHSYVLRSDTPATLGNTKSGMAEFDRRREFVAASGFPVANPFVLPSADESDWKKWNAKYTDYVKKNALHPYLPIFKRIASLIILKDMALLNGTSREEKDKISFYTKEMLDNGGGANTAISYYCLSVLKDTWPDDLVKKYADLSLAEMQRDRMTSSIKTDIQQMRTMRESGEAPNLDSTFVSGLEALLQQQNEFRSRLLAM